MTAPDFPPEVIEKAALALFVARYDRQPIRESFDDSRHHDCRVFARAVLAAVADDLIAEGARAEAALWQAQVRGHDRSGVMALDREAAHQRGMVAGARQVRDAIEAAIETLPTVVSTVGPDGWPAADHTAYRLYLDALRHLPQAARESADHIEGEGRG